MENDIWLLCVCTGRVTIKNLKVKAIKCLTWVKHGVNYNNVLYKSWKQLVQSKQRTDG